MLVEQLYVCKIVKKTVTNSVIPAFDPLLFIIGHLPVSRRLIDRSIHNRYEADGVVTNAFHTWAFILQIHNALPYLVDRSDKSKIIKHSRLKKDTLQLAKLLYTYLPSSQSVPV